MSQKFLSSLTLVNLAADPGSATAGEIYYNTGSSLIKYYNGSVWSTLSTGAVGAGLSANTFTSTQTITPATSVTGLAINAASSSIGLVIKANATTPGNLQEWQDSAGTVLTSVTSGGNLTANSFIPTGSTVPTNGIYLPAANTLGLATNSILQMRINATGNVGIGSAPAADRTLVLGKTITGSTAAYGIVNNGTIQSDVTSQTNIFYSGAITANANFNITTIRGYFADQGSFSNVTAGGTVTNQIGYEAGSALTGATNNYGFVGSIASATGRWNTFMSGTAANYFAGQTTVGSTSLTLGSGSVAQQFGVVSSAATNVGMVVRGAVSQTGDLTQWQNSAGTRLMSTSASGVLTIWEGDGTNNHQLVLSSNSAGSIIDATRSSGTATSLITKVDGVERVRITAGGTMLITSGAAAAQPLIVKGFASQTANLQEWQDSAGTVFTGISAGGGIFTNSNNSFNSASGFGGLGAFTNSSIVGISTNTASYIGLLVRGVASQTADLQQWQNSAGTVLASISQYGGLSSFYGQFVSDVATTRPLLVKGAASQTANLQEWQDSAGTVLAKVSSSGTAQFAGLDGGSA